MQKYKFNQNATVMLSMRREMLRLQQRRQRLQQQLRQHGGMWLAQLQHQNAAWQGKYSNASYRKNPQHFVHCSKAKTRHTRQLSAQWQLPQGNCTR